MRQQILDYYATLDPKEMLNNEDIELLISKQCKCDCCGKNVLKMANPPDIFGEYVYCEKCYDNSWGKF